MATTTPTARPRWHHCPLPGRHSEEASRHVTELHAKLADWISRVQASSGQPVAALADEDDIRCAIAGALARSLEWDGFTIGFELRLATRWPVDFELTAIIHRWSCDLKTRLLKAWHAQKKVK